MIYGLIVAGIAVAFIIMLGYACCRAAGVADDVYDSQTPTR